MKKSPKNNSLRKAQIADLNFIWEIIENAIEQRKKEGSDQWQDGYPNRKTIENDIENEVGYIYEIDQKIAAYSAIIFDIEPAYEIIEGNWESSERYAVIHRVAVSSEFSGQGIATQLLQEIEKLVQSQSYFVIKIDTIFDNPAMLKILENLKYQYCGTVYLRGGARKAFEKILK